MVRWPLNYELESAAADFKAVTEFCWKDSLEDWAWVRSRNAERSWLMSRPEQSEQISLDLVPKPKECLATPHFEFWALHLIFGLRFSRQWQTSRCGGRNTSVFDFVCWFFLKFLSTPKIETTYSTVNSGSLWTRLLHLWIPCSSFVCIFFWIMWEGEREVYTNWMGKCRPFRVVSCRVYLVHPIQTYRCVRRVGWN